MANIRYRTFQDTLDSLGGLINWSSLTAITSTQFTGIQQSYNRAANDAWIENNWLAVCPNGEARFVGNVGYYPNNLSVTTYWTTTAVTITGNNLANPADGRVTASKLLETGATSAHKVLQSYTYIPGATYQLTCYARPIGGRYLYLTAYDGVNTYSTFFNISTGVVGTQSSNLSAASTINQTANGFWVCSLFFTADSSAGTGTYGPNISSDGSTTSYTGDTANGIYSWGNVLTQTTYAQPTTLLIPNDQLGEEFIDSVFQVTQTSPTGAGFPAPITYQMMPDGVQIIGSNTWVWNGWLYTFPTWYTAGYPVFLYYRKGCPNYSGTAFSTTSTYTVDTQVLFQDSVYGYDFWKCAVATTANQSPENTPASWTELKLPDFLFDAVVYACYADYLRMDAQFEKAAQADALSQSHLDNQSDRQERQMGIQPPLRMATHLNSQGASYISR